MFKALTTFRKLLAATLLVLTASVAATAVRAQQVVVVVNGEPITALDIEQRSKLIQLSTHKAPPRQDVIDELINEKLKVREAKKFGLDIPTSEVDTAYASMASRMRYTPEQLTQTLANAGVNAATLKARIKADLTWPQLVRGRYQSSLQVGEKDLLARHVPARHTDRNPCDRLRHAQRPIVDGRPFERKIAEERDRPSAESDILEGVLGNQPGQTLFNHLEKLSNLVAVRIDCSIEVRDTVVD